jgi:hypothetical protein
MNHTMIVIEILLGASECRGPLGLRSVACVYRKLYSS